ncbi:MAG TPA: type II toxin-antitoxin system VapC family toxin [Candidatus Solibacter sp.]|jgi:predicted nucleic acid-binding protein|nr:type II toxin-antitoxin system VapC family toxin [Candidatus Solibacter sp.]
MATLLLDTSVIIDILNNKRGRPALLLDLVKAGHVMACCPINITEVYAGMRPKEEAATEELFASLKHFPIAPPAARLAGEFKRDYARKGTTLNLGDVIIAAVAIHNEVTLLTDNTKDFPMSGMSLYPLPK